jgi:hypothetical protein
MMACFLVGALGMAAVTWKAGLLGKGSTRPASPGSPTGESVRAEGVNPGMASPGETTGAQPAPVDSSLPPLVSTRVPSGMPTAVVASRAVIETSTPKPGIGQPVDFSARVLAASSTSHAKIDGSRFRISGPGIGAGTEVPAVDDGSGLFRTTFTFLQGGRFDVTFVARVDGASVRAARTIVVDSPPSLPPVQATGSVATPAPPSSAKWL